MTHGNRHSQCLFQKRPENHSRGPGISVPCVAAAAEEVIDRLCIRLYEISSTYIVNTFPLTFKH